MNYKMHLLNKIFYCNLSHIYYLSKYDFWSFIDAYNTKNDQYLDDDNISNISYQLFKFHFFVNTASNIASENFSVVDYYGPEYKVSIFDNKKYRLIIWLIFGFFVSLAFIILKEKRS